MNENQLRAKLIAAAKNNPPSDKAPYAFEKRILSRLALSPAPSVWVLWGGPLWRAALSCVVITVLCGIWAFAVERRAQPTEGFSQEFETAVCAPLSQQAEESL